MKKKSIWELIILLSLVAILGGCGNKVESSAKKEVAVGQEEKVATEEAKQESKEETVKEEEKSDETEEVKEQPKVSEPIQIATLNGPTGIGMVKLMEENNDEFIITAYQNPDEIVGKVISGELDIACVPSNLAAVLYNKTQGGIKLLGTNTLGVLYIVEKGESIKTLEDIKGKTILASGKGSTPEFILNNILLANGINPETDVTIEYMANHADVVSTLLADETNKIALLPEPHVTTAMAKGENLKVAIDINSEWAKVNEVDLPMGVIIVSKEFAANKPEDLDIFIEKYQASVEFVNNEVDAAAALVAKHQIVPSEAIAKNAIPKCNIVFRGSKDSAESLNKFYQIISEIEPKSVGGKLPDEAFYLNQ